MLLALHCCVVTAGDTVPDDGEYGLRILHQKWPHHMMIDVMDLFVGDMMCEGSDQCCGGEAESE